MRNTWLQARTLVFKASLQDECLNLESLSNPVMIFPVNQGENVSDNGLNCPTVLRYRHLGHYHERV